MCEDYRASASLDLKYDEADQDKKIACPLRVLWAEKGAMGRLYDVLGIWKNYGTKVTGRGLPGGHNLQEDVPDMVRRRDRGAAEDVGAWLQAPGSRPRLAFAFAFSLCLGILN